MRSSENNELPCVPVSGDRLRKLAIRGAGASVLSGGVATIIQLIGSIILARLLTPNDFGLVALVTTFSLIPMNFGVNGFTEAVLQREEIDQYLISNLFWLSVGAGVLLTIGFAGAGTLLARFYAEPLVTRVSIGISPTILLTSLSVVHQAVLRRSMRFSEVSFLDVLARLGSLAVSILTAWMGWGYWALIAGAVFSPLVQGAGTWYLCPWIPSLPRRATGTRSMTCFALNVYGRFILNYGSRNCDNLLVGWRFGAQSLGFYKRAYDLFALTAGQLTAPLTNVAVSALSRLNPRSPEYRQHLTSALSFVALVAIGVSGVLTLAGREIIRLLLGPKWDPAGQIFVYFGPGIGIMTIYYVNGWIHLSIGRADRWLRWGFVEFAVTCLSFLVGLRYGPEGVAIAWTVSFWILTVPAIWYAGAPVQLGLEWLFRAIWKYIFAALMAGLACEWIIRELQGFTIDIRTGELLVRTTVISALFGGLYLIVVILLHGGCAPLRQLSSLMREMIPARKLARAASSEVLR